MHPLSLSRRRLLGAATIGAGLTLFPALPAAASREVAARRGGWPAPRCPEIRFVA